MSEPIILGYWGIRGRAQVPRLLLAYTGANWTDKKYFSQDEWKGIGKDQTSLGIPFPNLPYLIQDELKISESKGIMNYIINISDKKNLLGKDIKDQAKVATLASVFTQLIAKISQLNMSVQNFKDKKPQVENFVEAKLQNFNSFFTGKEFVLGYLTLADFIITEASYYIQNVLPQVYEKHQFLGYIRDLFENLEEIKGYYSQQTAVKGPFLPPIGQVKF